MKDLLKILLVLVLVGVLAGGYGAWRGRNVPSGDEGAGLETVSTDGLIITDGKNRATQGGASADGLGTSARGLFPGSNTFAVTSIASGVAVSIPQVTLSAPGWIAVHDVAPNGVGNTLGATWLPQGTHKNVSIELLRGTIAGMEYFVALHADNGDKQYSSKIDQILTSDDGAGMLVAKVQAL